MLTARIAITALRKYLTLHLLDRASATHDRVFYGVLTNNKRLFYETLSKSDQYNFVQERTCKVLRPFRISSNQNSISPQYMRKSFRFVEHRRVVNIFRGVRGDSCSSESYTAATEIAQQLK